MTTVVNTYFPKRMTTDAGTKALTLNKPDPIVIGEPGFRYTAGSDEFGSIQYETANKTYNVGDKLELIVPHCDPVVNEYDVFYGVRKDRVELVWPVTATRQVAVVAGVLRGGGGRRAGTHLPLRDQLRSAAGARARRAAESSLAASAQSDFQVFEDRAPQTITAFTAVDIPAIEVDSVAAPDAPLSSADSVASNEHAEVDGRVYIFVLDNQAMEAGDGAPDASRHSRFHPGSHQGERHRRHCDDGNWKGPAPHTKPSTVGRSDRALHE